MFCGKQAVWMFGGLLDLLVCIVQESTIWLQEKWVSGVPSHKPITTMQQLTFYWLSLENWYVLMSGVFDEHQFIPALGAILQEALWGADFILCTDMMKPYLATPSTLSQPQGTVPTHTFLENHKSSLHKLNKRVTLSNKSAVELIEGLGFILSCSQHPTSSTFYAKLSLWHQLWSNTLIQMDHLWSFLATSQDKTLSKIPRVTETQVWSWS